MFLAPWASADSFTFSVVPQQNAIKTAQVWAPVIDYLAQVTGHEFKLRTAKDIPAFQDGLAEGIYDFAYMNPYHYTTYSESAGYLPLVHRAGNGIRGVVVIKKGSPIRSLMDLDGRVLGFPAPAAFAATLINRAEIKAAGATVTSKYTSSHDSVYRAVAVGLLDTGGGIGRTLKAADPKVRDQLEILHTTQEYTPHAVAVLPSVDESLRRQVQQALVDMQDLALLDRLKISGWQAAVDSDWDDVRALNLQAIQ